MKKCYWLRWGVFFILGTVLLGCPQTSELSQQQILIGVVSYDQVGQSQQQYQDFKDYLAQQTQTLVQLEPTYNELQAVEQIQRGKWSMVFAPPGLSAIAISEQQYIPIFPLEGLQSTRSVIVVREESPIQTLNDLFNRVVALGEPGSAVGYYLPLYDLYGLTLQEVRFAPTPQKILTWLEAETIDAGALSEQEFQRYRGQFKDTKFRVIHTTRSVPSGLVLLSPKLDSRLQIQIRKAMQNAPPNIVGDAGYLPNAPLPTYEQFIKFVTKVRPLEGRLKETPAVLTQEEENI